MEQNNRRKKVLIHTRFQFKLIAVMILINIVIMGVFGVIMFIFFNSELNAGLHRTVHTIKHVMDMLFPILATLTIINIVVSSIIIAVVILLGSHKIAGPLYRITATLDAMRNRDFGPMRELREGDQFIEVFRELKDMAQTIGGDIRELKSGIATAQKALESGNSVESKNALAALSKIIEHYTI